MIMGNNLMLTVRPFKFGHTLSRGENLDYHETDLIEVSYLSPPYYRNSEVGFASSYGIQM